MSRLYDWNQNQERLHTIIKRLEYKPEWTFTVKGWAGQSFYLSIHLNTHDSRQPSEPMLVDHQFPIPDYPMKVEELERWVLDYILLVERHEACEHFKLDGEAPFFPEHGANSDPYRVKRVSVESVA